MIKRASFLSSVAALTISFAIIYHWSGMFTQSLVAAIMTAVLVWGSYTILQWIYLAIKK